MNPVAPATAADAKPILELDGLAVSYFARAGEVPAVTGVSLALKRGESLGLVGESGCGKSTIALAIMRHMSGSGRIVNGTVRFGGRDMGGLDAEELRAIRGAGIAMVFQEPMSALNPSMTIGRQLVEVLTHHGMMAEHEARKRTAEVLADVKLPDVDRVAASYPHQLSGGQLQRVVIAMGLLARPAVLLLDEPTTSLDVTVEAGVIDLIAGLRQRYGTALVYISHNLGLIAQVCDRVAVMYAGEIVEQGPIADVFGRPRHPYTAALLRCIPVPDADKYQRPLAPIRGTVHLPQDRPPGCGFSTRCEHAVPGTCDRAPIPLEPTQDRADGLVRCVRWRELDLREKPLPPAAFERESTEEMLLTANELEKHYPVPGEGWRAVMGGERRWVKANQNLNFRVRRKQTLAIVGESGCGKTTFAKVLMGLESATGGQIVYQGVDLGALPVAKRDARLLRSLQMVFQNPDETLNPSYSVGTQVGRVVRKFGVERDAARVRGRVRQLLEMTRLPAAFRQRLPRQLSGGQKQRVAIARAFAGSPSVVVADEPVSALDVSVRAAITELLIDIQREHGTTLVMISHDLGLVRYIADRVVVMYLGQVMESGTADQVFAPPYHPYTEALLSAVPVADPTIARTRIVLEGEIPSATNPPKGCPFHTRCHRKLGDICVNVKPPEHRTGDGLHRIACHIPLPELERMEPVFRRGRPAAV
ncbi:MAG: dipeptide ABC transporter ATP-binding protein [Alphaproteobacteria bacterium]|nr:dipeptide ABC transporter ATP-binding protein [Alphaproteobacteria bacterium]